jgi:SAM-dependent methyltransferase
MNELHLARLASPAWQAYLSDDLLPWVLSEIDLGDDVLEIGPGPGLTTDLLRGWVDEITAVEADPELAQALRERLAGENVNVITADGANTGLPVDRFSAVTCFTVLHHVPTLGHQDALFAEARRVVRPGHAFVGTDALDSAALRAIHKGDTYVPVDPDTLQDRLLTAGFSDARVEISRGYSPGSQAEISRVRFVATK